MWVVSSLRASLGLEMLSRRMPTIRGSVDVRNELIRRVIMLITKYRHYR